MHPCSVHFRHRVLGALVSLLSAEDRLAVLVETKVSDLDVAGVEGDLGLLTVRLLLEQFLNVNAPSAAVDLGDLALATLVRATNHLHGVAVADGDAAGEPLSSQFLAQLSGHKLSAGAGGSSEVGLAGLSALAGHVWAKQQNISMVFPVEAARRSWNIRGLNSATLRHAALNDTYWGWSSSFR